MTWDRSELAKIGFFYNEVVRHRLSSEPYPPHVEALRSAMLDFSCPVLDYRDHRCDSNDLELDLTNSIKHDQHDDLFLKDVQDVQKEADRLVKGHYPEDSWVRFFQHQFFDPLVRCTTVSKQDSRRVSRCNYYYDSFRQHTNELWTIFNGTDHDLVHSEAFNSEKTPKPDCAFYLPMYNLDSAPRNPLSGNDTWQWHESPNTSLVEPFSWSVLKALSEHGLKPTPFRPFRHQPTEAMLKCYPWFIVEHKKSIYDRNSRPEEVVCCQALNASACAVQLNKIASKYAVELANDAQVPPTPVMTTVGSRVKIWITHFARDFSAPLSFQQSKCKQGFIMRAIWEGDMMKLNDVIMLRLILENTHTWAMRTYKPLISSHINQWRFVHSQPEAGGPASQLLRQQETMNRHQAVGSVVKNVLDQFSALEINDSKTLTPLMAGLIMQQICTTERQSLLGDIDRIVKDRMNALALQRTASAVASAAVVPDRMATAYTEVFTAPSRQSTFVDNDDPHDKDYQETPPRRTNLNDVSTFQTSAPGSGSRRSKRTAAQSAMQNGTPTRAKNGGPSVDETDVTSPEGSRDASRPSEHLDMASKNLNTKFGKDLEMVRKFLKGYDLK
ncbi:hypothetical protein B0I35DRAFT_437331 [Stachybotrys elegans]|uniref:Uncharacterized protein n=1 Tax=Stachybotrys elegans TaxID=80388 RepID=A0A8K0WNT3_9HYPO|nr:hypothetical protein B0I35DRAFT_437331 [Stachybotrys elegans]